MKDIQRTIWTNIIMILIIEAKLNQCTKELKIISFTPITRSLQSLITRAVSFIKGIFPKWVTTNTEQTQIQYIPSTQTSARWEQGGEGTLDFAIRLPLRSLQTSLRNITTRDEPDKPRRLLLHVRQWETFILHFLISCMHYTACWMVVPYSRIAVLIPWSHLVRSILPII